MKISFLAPLISALAIKTSPVLAQQTTGVPAGGDVRTAAT
jgi:hypothetical protein